MTRPQDAVAAAESGADAIGLVFYPRSPRHVTTERAREIVREVGPFVTVVGLFVDSPAESILRTADESGIHTVQLHGHETPELVAAVRPYNVIKAIHVEKDNFATTLSDWSRSIGRLQLFHLNALLLDTAHASAPGGTGLANDWETVHSAKAAGKLKHLPAIIAAGGLNAENVGDVIRLIRPFAVDVSSGVESAPGEKSREKIERFVAAVRAADRG